MTRDEIVQIVREVVRDELAAGGHRPSDTGTRRRANDAEAEYLRSMLAGAPEHSNVASALVGMCSSLGVSVTPDQLGPVIASRVARTMRAEDIGAYLPAGAWSPARS